MSMTQNQRQSFALRNYALHRLNEAPFAWCHVRTILIAAVGFFADAYDLFAVNFVNVLLGYVYYPDTSTLPSNIDVNIKMASAVGTVLGQLCFGVMIDLFGRKKMYGIELMIMIVATLGLTFAATGGTVNVIALSIFWRLVLGIGIGADYPNSSVLVSEFATVRRRGAMIASVFAAQGLGAFSAALVSYLCAIGFKELLNTPECDASCRLALDKAWRIVYGMGILPAVIALYFRLTIPETIRYTLDISRREIDAADDVIVFMTGVPVGQGKESEFEHVRLAGGFPAPPKASFRDFCRFFGLWKNGKVLLGTAGSWFLLDVAFVWSRISDLILQYGVALNTSTILETIGYGSNGATIFDNLRNLGMGNIVLSLAGLVPGYWFAVAFIDVLGRKRLQIGGFVALAVIFSVLGFGLHTISNTGLVVLVCMANFFCGFGPNSTTFVIPGEVFPTRYRSTGHGLSAAAGKIGVIISQVLIGPLANKGGPNAFLNHVMEIFALCMVLGIFTTLLVPESNGRTLEELTGELSFVPMPELSTGEAAAVMARTYGIRVPSTDEEVRSRRKGGWPHQD